MTKKQAIQLFEEKKVRTVWDDQQEKWYFSIVDVIGVLTDSANPQTYWRVLKNRLKKEGNETVTNCNAFKFRAADGKMRLTDVADTEQLFRLIQSVVSPMITPQNEKTTEQIVPWFFIRNLSPNHYFITRMFLMKWLLPEASSPQMVK